MTFAERLAAAMGRANATPRSLSNALGVSVQAIGQTLSGATRALTAENCAKAAHFLGVDQYWLATGLGEMRPASVELDMSLSSEERDLVIALRLLPPKEREAAIADVMRQARAQLARLETMLGQNSPRDPSATVVALKRP